MPRIITVSRIILNIFTLKSNYYSFTVTSTLILKYGIIVGQTEIKFMIFFKYKKEQSEIL
jgi:hypothetical protein